MDLSGDYLTKQIIAYIGNKRKLLGLVLKAIEQTDLDVKPGLKFFDVLQAAVLFPDLRRCLILKFLQMTGNIILTLFPIVTSKQIKKILKRFLVLKKNFRNFWIKSILCHLQTMLNRVFASAPDVGESSAQLIDQITF